MTAATAATVPVKTVTYQGRHFTVPGTWQVISLAARPHACLLL
jgi:hypothetical protein